MKDIIEPEDDPQVLVAKLLKHIVKFEETKAKYMELIYAVGMKYQDETRHETALRYINEREASHYPSGDEVSAVTDQNTKSRSMNET